MPRVHRRTKHRGGYTSAERRHLLCGHALFDVGFGKDEGFRDDEAADAWDELRDELLEEWVARFPGTRPWAWWRWDAPEQRRCVSGPGAAAFRYDDAPAHARKLHFGKPCCWWRDDFDNPSEYESQLACLERLGLLTNEEREAVAVSETDEHEAEHSHFRNIN